MRALVIGGGGPTGPYVVEGLRQRGYETAVLNRGVHPVDLPGDVELMVGDPHFADPLREAIGAREFDIVIASYGRLAVVAEVLAGRTDRFIGIGGFVAYRGFLEPAKNFPSGPPVPTPEDAPLVTDQAENRFAALVAQAEEIVFRHHPGATVFRYPYVYGPRQLVPREWSLVRRVLDGRRSIITVHGGMGLLTHGYAENLAHAVMLAVDQPAAAAGRAYNCGDEVQLDLRRFIEVAADELGVELDIISIPETSQARSIALMPMSDHKLMDISRIRSELGYRDRVPTVEAVRRTVRYYADHPLERGGEIEHRMYDAFDYAAEDRVIALAQEFRAKIESIKADAVPDEHPYAHPKSGGGGRDERGR